MLVRSLIEPLGFRISEAASVAEAESAVQTGQPDLVFMDWFLPDGSGLDAIGRIRSRRELHQPRIVMLTANALKESRQAARTAGADDFLSKPYEEDELYATLEKQLTIQFTRQQTQTEPSSLISSGEISASDLLGLPAEIRAELAQAALSLNPEQIAEALQHLAKAHPELAEGLRKFSDTRRYQRLWQVLGILDNEEQAWEAP